MNYSSSSLSLSCPIQVGLRLYFIWIGQIFVFSVVILAYVSRRLQRAFLIIIWSLSVVVFVLKFSHFHLLLQNHGAIFHQTWHKASSFEDNSLLFKSRARLFPRGENYEIAKIHRHNLTIFFPRTIGLISTKLCTMHPWVKEIQVYSTEGPHMFFKGR